MTTSHNGWDVITSSSDDRLTTIPHIIGRVRAGNVATVLAELVRRFHTEVEPVDVGRDDWGWSDRKVAGSTTWSNHASATAVDLNASRHPYGTKAAQNFTAGQIAAIRRILVDLPCLRWLDSFDPMHFEIRGDAASVARVARTITQPTTEEDNDMTPDQARQLARILQIAEAADRPINGTPQMDGAHLARTRQIAEVLDINVNGAGALARMAALLDAIAAKTLTADEITTASERGAKAALDARITAATVTLDVTTDHGADQ